MRAVLSVTGGCRRLLIAGFFACAISASAAASKSFGAYPGEFADIIEPSLKRNLGLAILELVLGDSRRAQAYARLAATPEHLKVYIDTGPTDFRRSQELTAWAHEAMASWNQVAHTSPFHVVTTRIGADVVIEFTDRVQGFAGRYAGFVTWRRTIRTSEPGARPIISAHVEIANRAPGGRLTNKNEVVKAVGHELGHVLGLDDSNCASHLMGPVRVGGPHTAPDSRERRALMDMDRRARAIVHGGPRSQNNQVPQIFTFAESALSRSRD